MFPGRTPPKGVRPGPSPNPVIPGFAPDPSVCRVGDVYYLVTSTFEYVPAITLWTSRDLTTWEVVGSVLAPDQLDLTGAHDSGGVYAPTIRHHAGVWYVVVTVVGGSHGSASYLVTTRDPRGRWDDPVRIEDAHGIDPSLLFDAGRVWWVANELVPGTESTCVIWLRELDLPGKRLIGPEHTIWTSALHGAAWTEAPHLYRVGGWYHLITAEGGTEMNHAVIAARARQVTGPYEGCPANPVLTHRHLGAQAEITAVGHADLVEAADGSWWAFCLGTRRIDGHHLLGRETFLVPVGWEDDWPVLGPGVGRVTDTVTGVGSPTGARAARGEYDFRDSAVPGPEWLSVRRPAAFTATEGGLLLEQGFLGLRLCHFDADLSLTVRPEPSAGGSAGLLFRQSDSHHVRLQLRPETCGWCVEVVVRSTGVDEVLAGAALTSVVGPVVLRGSLRGLELVVSAEYGGVTALEHTVDATVLSTETAGGFVGTVVGPYADGGARVLVESVAHVPTSSSSWAPGRGVSDVHEQVWHRLHAQRRRPT